MRKSGDGGFLGDCYKDSSACRKSVIGKERDRETHDSQPLLLYYCDKSSLLSDFYILLKVSFHLLS